MTSFDPDAAQLRSLKDKVIVLTGNSLARGILSGLNELQVAPTVSERRR